MGRTWLFENKLNGGTESEILERGEPWELPSGLFIEASEHSDKALIHKSSDHRSATGGFILFLVDEISKDVSHALVI